LAPDAGPPGAPSPPSATLPRVWQGIGYRPLPDPAAARALFDFAAVPWPDSSLALAWGAYAASARGERLVGAVAGEQDRRDILLHGPIVSTDDGPDDPLEVAAQLVAGGLDHPAPLGAGPGFGRPPGLGCIRGRLG